MTATALLLAVDLCAEFEGFRAYPYPDPASPLAMATRSLRWGFVAPAQLLATLPATVRALSGAPWTIGYGQTGDHVGPDTAAWPERIARVNLTAAVEDRVDMVRARTQIALTPGQGAALASFLYNVGPGRTGAKDGLFALKGASRPSTLWIRSQQGRHTDAAAQFAHWVNAGGRVMSGLVRRREAERRMYLTGNYR